MGRPQGSKNKAGHRAGGGRRGSGPKPKPKAKQSPDKSSPKKRLGKRKVRDDDDSEPQPPRRGFPPMTAMTASGSSIAGTSANSNPNPSRPMKALPMHPLFRQNSVSVAANSSSSATPNNPILPFIPVLIPGEDVPSSDPGIINIPEDNTSLPNVLPSQLASDTSDPPPETEPEPEGVVQQYLLQTMKDIRDKQLPLHKMPDCYRIHQTFWIRPPDRWFALQAYKSSPQDISPDVLYYPDIFVWLPGSLMPASFKFRCIFCEKDYMSDHGWNYNPVARRVVDLNSCYFILSKRVRCDSPSCHKSCTLYQDKILAQLPTHLANEFPAFLTHRSGIDKKVVTLIRTGIAHALTPNAWEGIFRELHVQNRDLGEQSYLHALKDCSPEQLPSNLVPFSSFSDRKGYAGFTPSRW
ncbi:hypothetical protein R3P38DRAFT_2801256 [Favolaschia claudopus]|uniref:DUF6729 domain-containing protein n=1 Tax=Favolaschia claudopus TaxID=2862362 RepID=A0AAV9ZWE3_9AGAR